MGFGVKDALVKVTKALKNGSGAVISNYIDTQKGTRGDQLAPFELLLTAPALTTSALPNNETMTYVIAHSDTDGNTAPATLFDNAIVQAAGTGSTGASLATSRHRLPTNAKRFIAVKATNSGAGNASGVSATLEGYF